MEKLKCYEIEPIDPIRIAITGGPCAGKTSVLEAIHQKFQEEIVVVPEAASLLLPGFLAVKSEIDAENIAWQKSLQRSITAAQIELEETYTEYARDNNIAIVLCDRGLLDAYVYTPSAEYLLETVFGLTYSSMLDRYTSVIHLESLATAAPGQFSSVNNTARYESVREAREIEKGTRAVWQEHNEFNLVEGSNLANKILVTKSIIERYLY